MKVVDVVPLESLGYAIAYGNEHVVKECLNVSEACFNVMSNSVLMEDCIDKASRRVFSGLPLEVHAQLVNSIDKKILLHQYEYQYTYTPDEKTLTLLVYPLNDKTKAMQRKFSFDEIENKYNVVPDPKYLDLLSNGFCALNEKVISESTPTKIICNMNISCLYMVSQSDMLQSPIETLYLGKKKLASLAENSRSECTDSSSSFRPSADMASLENSLMLKTVNDIREKELAICTSLLAGFMEHTEIDIPLMKSDKDRSKALELSASASVGVWALSSLNYEHIQPILKQCRGEQLLVKIEEYIKGIVEAEEMAPSPLKDAQYAAKLQFIVQGVTKTVTCNSQYISYSLERQLADICNERKITEDIPLEKLTSQWDIFFDKNILSLIPKTHRSLIARWLKWALMVYNLREQLARYTAVGVVGLVNSGKSRLITTLFKIQVSNVIIVCFCTF